MFSFDHLIVNNSRHCCNRSFSLGGTKSASEMALYTWPWTDSKSNFLSRLINGLSLYLRYSHTPLQHLDSQNLLNIDYLSLDYSPTFRYVVDLQHLICTYLYHITDQNDLPMQCLHDQKLLNMNTLSDLHYPVDLFFERLYMHSVRHFWSY